MSNTTNMCINVHLEFNELHLGYKSSGMTIQLLYNSYFLMQCDFGKSLSIKQSLTKRSFFVHINFFVKL